MRVVVTGARGQLGGAIVREFSSRHEVVPLERADLDITDNEAVRSVMEGLRPEVVVNCAAYNEVDGAEANPVDALNCNAFAVRALAETAVRYQAVLVHYSTDFIFDGTKGIPYVEDDRPNPRSVYASSKLLGEWFASDVPRWYVLRVESLFGRAEGGPLKGTIASIWNKLAAGQEVRVFHDRTVSPTSVIDAARATRELVEREARCGAYHCVNSGCCTWVEFATELARLLGVEPKLVPVSMADVPLRAARPQYCALSNEQLRSVGIEMPSWQDALRRFVDAERSKPRA